MHPKMSKEMYHAAGAKASAQNDPPARLKPGSWQAAAYNRGYAGVPLEAPAELLAAAQREAGTRVLGVASRQIGKSVAAVVASMPAGINHWPLPAREHARRLIVDVARERSPLRRERLLRALRRMEKRHNVRPDPLAIPMTTVPCPEGPVTVRDLLQGR